MNPVWTCRRGHDIVIKRTRGALLKEVRMMSTRSLLAVIVFSVVLTIAFLVSPPMRLAQSSGQPTAEEAKRAKARIEEKAARDAKESLKGSQQQEMKLRGRNKPGDYPVMDEKGPAGGDKKLKPGE
jgi:hypothetical protein